ncbi:hypothetical protein [Dictyobacter vulcani]|nr:hypothetical protein [Dictyobacter vulcani]
MMDMPPANLSSWKSMAGVIWRRAMPFIAPGPIRSTRQVAMAINSGF